MAASPDLAIETPPTTEKNPADDAHLPPETKKMLAEVSQKKEPGIPHTELKLRVYISHGKNRAFVDSLKEVAGLSELEPVVSVENESAAISVPEKVMADMRSCGGAIIHVDGEMALQDSNGKQIVVLNSNVLIEIGAALALYGKRFIALCKKGIELPSNLQGLYRIDYEGPSLSADDTIRLLKAIKQLKSFPLPSHT
jgi:predicted nucleotide-binding protein